MSGQEKLEAATKQLEQTNRLAAETEEVATATLGELRRQREVINKTRAKVQDTSASLDQSRKTINNMNSSCSVA